MGLWPATFEKRWADVVRARSRGVGPHFHGTAAGPESRGPRLKLRSARAERFQADRRHASSDSSPLPHCRRRPARTLAPARPCPRLHVGETSGPRAARRGGRGLPAPHSPRTPPGSRALRRRGPHPARGEEARPRSPLDGLGCGTPPRASAQIDQPTALRAERLPTSRVSRAQRGLHPGRGEEARPRSPLDGPGCGTPPRAIGPDRSADSARCRTGSSGSLRSERRSCGKSGSGAWQVIPLTGEAGLP
jgi:hypothetical protein